MPLGEDLLDALNGLGSRVRYGISPEDKYKAILQQPEYTGPSRESDKTEAERRVSSALATQQWGPLAPFLFNLARESAQGVGAMTQGKPFLTPGGFNADDSTVSDEDPTSGFNLRSIATGLNASADVDPRLGLVRAGMQKVLGK